jgi:hypothetical protein
MKCTKCKRLLDRNKDVIAYIRIEYPQSVTLQRVWCRSCYQKGA